MSQSYKPYDAIVIGAGPAGLMAAIRAAQRGKRVLVLEKNDMPGRKLLISGKGRCNLTNANEDIREFLKHFSSTGKFLMNAFHIFFNTDLMSFFESRGVELKTERGNRVFPGSDSSRDILDALMAEAKKSRVAIEMSSDVTGVKQDGVFTVTVSGGRVYIADKVVIATGGLSYPHTGCTGFGYAAAATLGHTVVKPRPALVGVNLAHPPLAWQGIALKNVSCSVISDCKTVESEFGEMLFTHFGVSGPIILDLSARVHDEVSSGKKVSVSIDLKPALSHELCDARLLRDFEESKGMALAGAMALLMPRNMAGGFLAMCGLKPDQKTYKTTRSERAKIAKTLKDIRFAATSARPIDEAIVTRGGVSVKEIDPKTMESKITKGLYFAGELIDVDAKTGGYNLQAAFSTGYVAGDNI